MELDRGDGRPRRKGLAPHVAADARIAEKPRHATEFERKPGREYREEEEEDAGNASDTAHVDTLLTALTRLIVSTGMTMATARHKAPRPRRTPPR